MILYNKGFSDAENIPNDNILVFKTITYNIYGYFLCIRNKKNPSIAQIKNIFIDIVILMKYNKYNNLLIVER